MFDFDDDDMYVEYDELYGDVPSVERMRKSYDEPTSTHHEFQRRIENTRNRQRRQLRRIKEKNQT